MLIIDSETNHIHLTRGNIAPFSISAKNDDGTKYQFQVGDIVTFSIYAKKNMSDRKLTKSVEVIEPTQNVLLTLTSEETKLDDIINKPNDYWYEVELNNEQTIIGYDKDGAKILTLYPEGE